MAVQSWSDCLTDLKPYIYKISTPDSSGTGFQITFAPTEKLLGIATALHVVAHAHNWEEPIKLVHHKSGESMIVREPDRIIYTYPNKDLAFILVAAKNLPANDKDLNLIEPKMRKVQGVHMGWCGFPAVAPNDLCFFTGHMSSWLNNETAYLVDGVAINGVSGGPAFTAIEGGLEICGVVSAYVPNRATGEALPGVCLIRDVGPYQHALQQVFSFVEAKKAKAEQELPVDELEQEPEQKVAKKKVAKKKVAKKKVAKKKVAKRKVAKRKVAKRKVAKRKVAKRKVAKRKVAKRKVAKRKARRKRN